MRKAIVAVLSVTAFATSMFAQTKPNFSGTWKLNVAKSDFGPVPAPDSRTDVIDHSEPGVESRHQRYRKARRADIGGHLELHHRWQGSHQPHGPARGKSDRGLGRSKLVVNAKTTYQDAELGIKSIWVLSDDGKTLTQNVHYSTPMGEADQTLIYDKQDAGAATAAAPAATMPKPRRLRLRPRRQPPVSSPISAGHGSWMSRNPTLAFFRLTTAAPT